MAHKSNCTNQGFFGLVNVALALVLTTLVASPDYNTITCAVYSLRKKKKNYVCKFASISLKHSGQR